MDYEPVADREKAVHAMLALYDLLDDVRAIRALLEDGNGEEVQEDLEQ